MQLKTARMNITRDTITQWGKLIVSKYLTGYINLSAQPAIEIADNQAN